MAEDVLSARAPRHGATDPTGLSEEAPEILLSGGSRRAILSLNPATEEVLARVPVAGPGEIDAVGETAAAASQLWRASPFSERRRLLERLAELILEQADEIASLVAREQGKPLVEARSLEVLPALDHLRYLARHAEAFYRGEGIHARQPLYAHKRALYLYDPLGVLALITPFSMPFALPLVQVASAVATGNAVVLKPSELTPLCGLRVGELFLEAGFPQGLVGVVPAAREEVVELITHPRVGKIFATGSVDMGQEVMAIAGCLPRPVVLSLGGKHPAVVAPDADIERAARGIVWGALANAGQNCGAVERVYVDQAVARGFVERVLQEVDSIRMGDPLEEGVDLGPLVSDERRRRVHEQVVEAVGGGGRLLRGGEIPEGPGFFYPPTVVLNPPPGCALLTEETLGPVVTIVTVEHLERAVYLANESEYALTASGWTRSETVADRLLVGLKAGVVTINDVLYSFGEPASSWSGHRRSGIGQNHGVAGLREMCQQRFVSSDLSPAKAPLFSFPYDRTASAISRLSLRALHARRRLPRFGQLLRLIRIGRFRARVPLRSFLAARGRKHER